MESLRQAFDKLSSGVARLGRKSVTQNCWRSAHILPADIELRRTDDGKKSSDILAELKKLLLQIQIPETEAEEYVEQLCEGRDEQPAVEPDIHTDEGLALVEEIRALPDIESQRSVDNNLVQTANHCKYSAFISWRSGLLGTRKGYGSRKSTVFEKVCTVFGSISEGARETED
jgi:hypothetical protein